MPPDLDTLVQAEDETLPTNVSPASDFGPVPPKSGSDILTKDNPIAIGLIGGGYIGQKRIAQLTESSENVEIRSICDTIQATRQEVRDLAKESGILAAEFEFAERAEQLNYKDLDGVLIATPPKFHCEQIQTALQHNVHALVEKPLAMSIEECEQIRYALTDSAASLWVAYQKRDLPCYRAARELITQGALGEIEKVSMRRVKHSRGAHEDGWRADPEVAGGGQLFDIGNHMLDILLWLTDQRPDLDTHKGTLQNHQGTEVEIYADVVGELTGGISYNLSMHAYGAPSIEDIYISGSDAGLRVTKDEVRLFEQDDSNGRAIQVPEKPYHWPTDILVDIVRYDGLPEPDLERWINSVKITQKIYQECTIYE